MVKGLRQVAQVQGHHASFSCCDAGLLLLCCGLEQLQDKLPLTEMATPDHPHCSGSAVV
jgi:hypothetical protein